MRAVIQRVSGARVEVDGRVVSEIGKGLLVLLGVGREDGESDVEWLAEKVVNLRIFEDGAGKLSVSALDCGAELLVVSQFTLYGDCRKGRRPSFTGAAAPEKAEELYRRFLSAVAGYGLRTQGGVFGAKMKVHLVNDGPVTILLSSPVEFGYPDEDPARRTGTGKSI